MPIQPPKKGEKKQRPKKYMKIGSVAIIDSEDKVVTTSMLLGFNSLVKRQIKTTTTTTMFSPRHTEIYRKVENERIEKRNSKPTQTPRRLVGHPTCVLSDHKSVPALAVTGPVPWGPCGQGCRLPSAGLGVYEAHSGPWPPRPPALVRSQPGPGDLFFRNDVPQGRGLQEDPLVNRESQRRREEPDTRAERWAGAGSRGLG